VLRTPPEEGETLTLRTPERQPSRQGTAHQGGTSYLESWDLSSHRREQLALIGCQYRFPVWSARSNPELGDEKFDKVTDLHLVGWKVDTAKDQRWRKGTSRSGWQNDWLCGTYMHVRITNRAESHGMPVISE
jgi:hypothetical protein